MIIPLEQELDRINKMIFEMYELVKAQLTEARQSILESDREIADSIERRELRVNEFESTIDDQCENILARYNPVATDLRLIISVIRMSESLERISDHAYRMARYVREDLIQKDKKLFKSLELEKLFDTVLVMLDTVFEAIEHKDAELAKEVFKKDRIVDKMKQDAPEIIEKILKEDIKKVKNALYLFSVITKLERTGDVINNIAEELVFYVEAEKLKHLKRNAKILKRHKKM